MSVCIPISSQSEFPNDGNCEQILKARFGKALSSRALEVGGSLRSMLGPTSKNGTLGTNQVAVAVTAVSVMLTSIIFTYIWARPHMRTPLRMPVSLVRQATCEALPSWTPTVKQNSSVEELFIVQGATFADSGSEVDGSCGHTGASTPTLSSIYNPVLEGPQDSASERLTFEEVELILNKERQLRAWLGGVEMQSPLLDEKSHLGARSEDRGVSEPMNAIIAKLNSAAAIEAEQRSNRLGKGPQSRASSRNGESYGLGTSSERWIRMMQSSLKAMTKDESRNGFPESSLAFIAELKAKLEAAQRDDVSSDGEEIPLMIGAKENQVLHLEGRTDSKSKKLLDRLRSILKKRPAASTSGSTVMEQAQMEADPGLFGPA